MKSFLYSQLWFTVIVICECLKWIAAGQLIKYIGWLRHLAK